MFIMNGIVYASECPDELQIVDVKPLEDMMMILTFQPENSVYLMQLYYLALHLNHCLIPKYSMPVRLFME